MKNAARASQTFNTFNTFYFLGTFYVSEIFLLWWSLADFAGSRYSARVSDPAIILIIYSYHCIPYIYAFTTPKRRPLGRGRPWAGAETSRHTTFTLV